MSAVGEVKKLSKSRIVILIVGIILGGTVLSVFVATAWHFVKTKIPFLKGRSPAEIAAANAAGNGAS